MRVAVSNIAWEPAEDVAVASRLRAAGISAVEIAPTKVWPELGSVPLAQAKSYGQQWERAGLPVVAAQSLLFGRPDLRLFDETRDELVDYLGRVIELCAAMGAAALVFGSPRNRQRAGLPADVAHRVAVDAFGHLAERASTAGACLCLEPNPTQYDSDYLTTAEETAALVRAVDSAGLRLHLDTACMDLAGDDSSACAAKYAELLRHVHLSEPFLGPVGIPNARHVAFADALRTARYEHYVSVEMRPSAKVGNVPAVERAARYAVAICGDT
jgi:D-psicose/D-tagatose/L-ribulose 3-epimerase